MVWNLAGVFLRQCSRNLMKRFLINAPVPEILRFTFLFRNLQNVNLNISGTGALIKNHFIRFLELCLRNTPAKFQTMAPSQFFRKWRRSWKNSPEIRRFKVQASYTIACKLQPLRHDTREGEIRLTYRFLHLVSFFQLYNILKNQNRAFFTPRPHSGLN